MKRSLSLPILILLLLSTFFIPSAKAYTTPHNVSENLGVSPYAFSMSVAAVGDLIVVELQIENNAVALPTATIGDSFGDSFSTATDAAISFNDLTPPACNSGGCAGTWIFYAQAKSSGSDTITITYANSIGGGVEAQDVQGVPINVQGRDLGNFVSNPTTVLNGGSPLAINGAETFAVMSIFTTCSASYTFTAGAGFTASSASIYGQAMYGTPTAGPTGSTTDFPATCSSPVGNFLSVEAVFGAIFTCSITDMGAGDYVVANLIYNYFCEVQSPALSSTNAAITDLQMSFNDSVNTYTFEYNNSTGTASIDSGGSIASLGGVTASSGYDDGVRTLNVTFPITLGASVIDSQLRGIELYAENANGVTLGPQYVQTKYFNIINRGGYTTFALDGSCSIPAGADTFQTICQYGSNAHNWIAENSTYYDLQQYQGQFAIQLSRASNGLDESAFWQNYANSGSGTNPSSNKGDWQIDSGFYYYDNTTSQWIKGINVKLEMVQGRVGSTNLWTEFQAAWYNGNALVANQTFYAFVPNDSNGSAVNIWLNFWYSQNNASTTQGGQVSAYYTGMHSTDYLLWNSWSPFLGNSTQSQVFMPILNGDGDTISVQNTQFTRVFMNMSRPGAPNIHTNQPNFQVQTNNFQEQEFNVGTGTISGITTPTFTAAIVPTISSGSIFSPIINALKALADDIGKVFLALGNVVWAGLASRFPWFTSFWDSVGAGIVSFASLMLKIFTYVLDGLTLVSIALRYVGYPFEIISGAVGWIEGLFSWLGPFSGQSAQEFVVIIVVLYFVGDIMSAAERGDTAHFISLAQGAWRILDTIMWWTYLFVKFIIDSIEGLIP